MGLWKHSFVMLNRLKICHFDNGCCNFFLAGLNCIKTLSNCTCVEDNHLKITAVFLATFNMSMTPQADSLAQWDLWTKGRWKLWWIFNHFTILVWLCSFVRLKSHKTGVKLKHTPWIEGLTWKVKSAWIINKYGRGGAKFACLGNFIALLTYSNEWANGFLGEGKMTILGTVRMVAVVVCEWQTPAIS